MKEKNISWRNWIMKAAAAVQALKGSFSARYMLLNQRLLCLDQGLTRYQTRIFWILAILYRFAEDALYVWGTSVYYAYNGMVYTPSSWKYLLSWILFLVMFAYMPKEEENVGSFLLHVQFVYTVCPLLTFFGISNGSTVYMLMVFVCIMLETWLVRSAPKTMAPPHIKGIQNYTTVALGILVISSLAIPVLYNGFAGLKAFDFQYIYEMRASATYPVGFSYIFSWIAKAVVPFALLYFFHQKKYRWALLAGAVQILLYMESGEKFILLVIFPLLAVYFLAKSRHLIKMMYSGLAVMYLLILLMARMDIPQEAPSSLGLLSLSIVGQRAVHGPAMNKFLYYSLFHDYPKIFFSDGQIGNMLGLTYPYAAGSGQLIYAYGGGEFGVSNSITGYLGESYAQMGFVGMLLMSLLFGWILRGLSSYRERALFPVLTGLFTMYVIILNDAPLFTTLFSGGMLVSYLLVFIYLSKRPEGENHGIQRL